MSFTVPSRRVAALAMAGTGLAVALAGGLTPAANASSGTVASAARVNAASASWFQDPRTPAQRRQEVAVPKRPAAYSGQLSETRAAYRTRAGKLAVPMGYAFGHQVDQGQAVTISGRDLHMDTPGARARIGRLADALGTASALRCEGYSDYVGTASNNRRWANRRATAVCDLLAVQLPAIATSTVSYGRSRPALVGGTPSNRAFNRRVVVEMTGTRGTGTTTTAPGVQPPTPHSTAPAAATDVTASAIGTTVTIAFTPPADDGGTEITAWEVQIDEGAWTAASVDESGHITLTGQAPGTHTYSVRGVNRIGPSPAATSEVVHVLAPPVPEAPVIRNFGYNGTAEYMAWMVYFNAGADNGATVTGWQVSVDGAPWVDAAYLIPDNGYNGTDAVFPCSAPTGCGWDYTTPIRLRAVTADGYSEASQPFSYDPMMF